MNSEITINKLFKEQLTILQHKKGYRFSVDSPILANFVYENDKENTYFEVGTGSGIIPIVMSFLDKRYQKIKKIYTIEVQKALYELAKENFKLNNVKNIEFISGDIRNIKEFIKPNIIDVVFSNPPFFEL
jgi:tRNA1Val (adenine37-N6)-methyltransferase